MSRGTSSSWLWSSFDLTSCSKTCLQRVVFNLGRYLSLNGEGVSPELRAKHWDLCQSCHVQGDWGVASRILHRFAYGFALLSFSSVVRARKFRAFAEPKIILALYFHLMSHVKLVQNWVHFRSIYLARHLPPFYPGNKRGCCELTVVHLIVVSCLPSACRATNETYWSSSGVLILFTSALSTPSAAVSARQGFSNKKRLTISLLHPHH